MLSSYTLNDNYAIIDEALLEAKKLVHYSNDLIHNATKILCLAVHFSAKAEKIKTYWHTSKKFTTPPYY